MKLLFALMLLNTTAFARDINKINFIPISHASFIILAGNTTIYIDPTGTLKDYEKMPPPDIILITHTHYDHFDKKLLTALKKPNTIIIGTKNVINELSYGEILNNGENKTLGDINIEAIPAYNLTSERLQYHPKGIGNGYVITIFGKRIYVSGDTEDIIDMKNLKMSLSSKVCK